MRITEYVFPEKEAVAVNNVSFPEILNDVEGLPGKAAETGKPSLLKENSLNDCEKPARERNKKKAGNRNLISVIFNPIKICTFLSPCIRQKDEKSAWRILRRWNPEPMFP